MPVHDSHFDHSNRVKVALLHKRCALLSMQAHGRSGRSPLFLDTPLESIGMTMKEVIKMFPDLSTLLIACHALLAAQNKHHTFAETSQTVLSSLAYHIRKLTPSSSSKLPLELSRKGSPVASHAEQTYFNCALVSDAGF